MSNTLMVGIGALYIATIRIASELATLYGLIIDLLQLSIRITIATIALTELSARVFIGFSISSRHLAAILPNPVDDLPAPEHR